MGSTPADPPPLHTHTCNMAQSVLFAALLASASARPQYPVAAPVPVEAYPDLPPVYNYQYGVNDQGYSNSVFSQSSKETEQTQAESTVSTFPMAEFRSSPT